MIKFQLLTLASALAAVSFCTLPAWSIPTAGNPSAPPASIMMNHPDKAAIARSSARRKAEFRGDQIMTVPNLPNLPMIQGKCQLLRGFSFNKTPGCHTYNLRMVCDRPPQEIHDWYQTVFSTTPWILDTLVPSGPFLTARDKDKHICQVVVLQGIQHGRTWQTQFSIIYTFLN